MEEEEEGNGDLPGVIWDGGDGWEGGREEGRKDEWKKKREGGRKGKRDEERENMVSPVP